MRKMHYSQIPVTQDTIPSPRGCSEQRGLEGTQQVKQRASMAAAQGLIVPKTSLSCRFADKHLSTTGDHEENEIMNSDPKNVYWGRSVPWKMRQEKKVYECYVVE